MLDFDLSTPFDPRAKVRWLYQHWEGRRRGRRAGPNGFAQVVYTSNQFW